MKRVLALVLLSAVALTGCESIFGKEEGKRGALPGKREDVFAADAGAKPDDALKDAAIDLGTAVDKTEWTSAGGSPTRLNGAINMSANPSEAWSTSIGAGSTDDGVLIAEPVVANGIIYTIDSEGVVRATNAASGNRAWSQQVPDPHPDGASNIAGAGLAYANGRIVATTTYGNVVSMDAATGKIAWQKQLPAPFRSSPFIADDKIYVTALTNTLYELNFADGTSGWSHTGIQENASFLGMASPTQAEDLIIVPYSSGEVFGLRKINGRLAWEENLASTRSGGALPAMADIQGEPVIDGTRALIASHSGRIVALDTRSGRTVWETDVGSVQTPWVAGNSIFIVTPENQLVAMARDDGRVRWSAELPRYLDPDDKTETMSWVGPVLAGGKLWIASSEGEVKGLNPMDGKELTRFSVDGPVYLAPIAVGGSLYVLTDRGTLYAYR
jgi:outer membrane protein assembly factor BamB